MSNVTTQSVVRQIESLYGGGSIAGLSDRQLVERFVTRRDAAGEDAFAALVARHGPMVLRVCRALLGNRQDAEDAFQAVFLVLARKAGSVRDPDLLCNWLYGIGLRTARKARARLARQQRAEEDRAVSYPEACTTMTADQAAMACEQAETLHAEIERLPGLFRVPVVLCYFEGLTLDQAALRLRCPAGTVHSRLARARDRLRRGLTRRGIVMPAATVAAALAAGSASASVSSQLCETTARAAIQFAAGQSAAPLAAALAQEVLRAMLSQKVKLISLTLLLLGAVATSAGYLTSALSANDEPRITAARRQTPVTEKLEDPKPGPGRMFVVGRVVDPSGEPVKGAVVDVLTIQRKVRVGASATDAYFTVLGQGETDGDGQFRLQTPRTSWTGYRDLIALGTAPGFGLGWADLNPDASQPGADLRLRPEQVIRLKLLDVRGSPAAGVEVRIRYIKRSNDRGEFDGVRLLENPPREIRAWPSLAKTDGQGRLVLSGIGRDLSISLSVADDRFARQYLKLQTDSPGASKEIILALQPAQIIEGFILAGDTLQPIPNAVVSATTRVRNEIFTSKFHADANGRFRMNPIIGDKYTIGAFPTGGEPYLIRQDELSWAKGAVNANHDIKLPRGVLIRGKVTERGTGRPIAGSSIQYIPLPRNNNVLSDWQATVPSLDDGSYQIAVPPGTGHLLVFGPTPEYVLKEIGANRLFYDKPGGIRYRAHDIIAYEVKAGDQPAPVGASLRAGVTLKGRVLGPDGQTVTEAFLLTTLRVEPTVPDRVSFRNPVRDGRFELHGIAPEATTRVSVFDPGHEWGASVDFSGKQAGEELTIRLQPCSHAKARFVGPDGKPVTKHRPNVEFVATPGPPQYSRNKRHEAELSADEISLGNVDRTH
jgi:RNA polymerase sigma factor (sigma-70 family)